MFAKLFTPRSVALIGASADPEKLGFLMLQNLLNAEYHGNVYAVNPKGGEILGQSVFEKSSYLPTGIDLAVVAVPAAAVETVVRECAEQGITDFVIISAGFGETGSEGKKREEALIRFAAEKGITLVGPNCLGVLNPHAGLNASFAEELPEVGNIGLISQSGAMAVALTDWAAEQNIGFSKIISLGNKAGVNENDLLEHLATDEKTGVIALYLESFVDGRKFFEIAARTTLQKPVILLKAGITAAGKKAVSSHTGALAGSDTAVTTALRQAGVIRAHTVEELFELSLALSMQPLPQGNRVAIVTNAGGPGILATDALEQSNELELALFTEGTSQKLSAVLPTSASTANPVDIVGDARADRYEGALEAVYADPNVESILTMLTPQVMTEKERTVRILTQLQQQYPEKTTLTAFMGGKNISYAVEKLSEANIPNFLAPERAIQNLAAMAKLAAYRQEKKKGGDTLSKNRILSDEQKESFHRALQKNTGTQLAPEISREILKAYGITVPEVFLAQDAGEAVQQAEKIGYPVVLKISSDEVLHKTDAGGVRLALKNEKEVRKGYAEILKNIEENVPDAVMNGILVQKMYHFGRETIIGMKRDPNFGPLIMFGLGGVYVEVLKDVSFRLAPFSKAEAEKMMQEVKAIQLLTGVRGEARADIEQLGETLLAVSQLAVDFPEISELDLNPLLVLPEGKGVMAIDTRFLLAGQGIDNN